jgi:anti-sigma factor RsiW
MDCSKCDEMGLLFASGELDDAQTTQLQQHLAACPPCNQEFSQYSLEKKEYFTPDILCEETPRSLDEKIFSLCSKPMMPTGIGLFSLTWVKRTVLSALIFALGVSAGGYFTFAYYQAKTSGRLATAANNSSVAQSTAPAAAVAANASKLALDTAKRTFPSVLPNQGKQASPGVGAPSQGIVTVDLKKE